MKAGPQKKKSGRKKIESYEHAGKKRANNPPVGLVTAATDPESGRKSYACDPHLRQGRALVRNWHSAVVGSSSAK